MKRKQILILFPLFINLVLSACDPGTYNFDYEELKNNVAGVELINYNNLKVRKIKNIGELLPFDFNLMEIIEVLPEEKIDTFLKEYSTAYFLEIFDYLDSPNGKGLRLLYKNDDFMVICLETYYVCKFDASGNVKHFFTYMYQMVLIRIINKYFNTKV